jgi:1-acyl-sn-glycerol-3-phosphate acyltransferase
MDIARKLRAALVICYVCLHLACITFPGFLFGIVIASICRVFRGGVGFRKHLAAHTVFHGALLFGALQPLLGVQSTFHLEEAIEALRRAPPKQGMLVVANHQSTIDILLICALMWRLRYWGLRWVMKIELDTPFNPFGRMARLIECIFVDRSDGKKAIQALLEGTARIFAEGACLLIFPEGTRAPEPIPGSRYTKLGAPKQAGCHAIVAQHPNIPVLAFALSWHQATRDEAFGRTFVDARGFLDQHLEVWGWVIQPEAIAADPEWLEHIWDRMEQLL